ncbi:MAG: hypothetical protein ABW046_22705 [Actinoplanes sp.]
MIHIGCNLCRRIIADDDEDAVREGIGPAGKRVDICGCCMREAAERVADRLRAVVKVADPMPQTVRQRALSVRLPHHLQRKGT